LRGAISIGGRRAGVWTKVGDRLNGEITGLGTLKVEIVTR